MSTFYLIRHGAHGLLGHTMTGRMPGVHLSDEGRAQAEALADRLASAPLSLVYSSPLERARETAEPVARRHGLEVRTADALHEIDIGVWTGLTFEALHREPLWAAFNQARGTTRPPSGELMLEVQTRMVGLLARLAGERPDAHVACVGHADPIKAAVLFFLGAPLDHFHRIEVGPASVSIVELNEWGPKVMGVNG